MSRPFGDFPGFRVLVSATYQGMTASTVTHHSRFVVTAGAATMLRDKSAKIPVM